MVGRARAVGRLLLVFLIVLSGTLLASPNEGTAATECGDNAPFWKTVYCLPGVTPSSVVSDGQRLYILDADLRELYQLTQNRSRQISFEPIGDPIPLDIADVPPLSIRPCSTFAGMGAIALGPRSFYALAETTAPDGEIYLTLFRADRLPDRTVDEWRPIRQVSCPESPHATLFSMSNLLWTFRASSGFSALEWQSISRPPREGMVPTSLPVRVSPGERVGAAIAGIRNRVYVFGGQGASRDATVVKLVNGAPTAAESLGTLPTPRNGAIAVTKGNFYVYLVGGNQPGDPTIHRGRLNADGSIASWEVYPEPPDGAPIISAVLAQGYLWLLRADGAVHRALLADGAAGRARIEWDVDLRPRVVHAGQTLDIPVDWRYVGPVVLTGITAKVVATPAQARSAIDAGLPPPAPFAWLVTSDNLLVETTPLTDPMTPPSDQGPRLCLRINVPATSARTEYMATIQVRSENRSVGPALRLRFVLARPLIPPAIPGVPTVVPTPTQTTRCDAA